MTRRRLLQSAIALPMARSALSCPALGPCQFHAPAAASTAISHGHIKQNIVGALKNARISPQLPAGVQKFTIPAVQSVLPRKDLNCLSEGEGNSLATAYANLRADTTPAGLQGQAALHFWASGGASGNDVHASEGALFLAWYRAHLYFHERTLQYALKSRNQPAWQSFRLPYWNIQDFTSKPCLYQCTELRDKTRFWDKPDDSNNQVLKDPVEFSADCGSSVDLSKKLQTWHWAIHQYVAGDMRSLRYCGLDPLFYAWHSNVDRAWFSANLTDQPAECWAPFYDPFASSTAGSWVWANLREFAETGRLGYHYDQKFSADPVSAPGYDYYLDFSDFQMPESTSGQYHLQAVIPRTRPVTLRTFFTPAGRAIQKNRMRMSLYPFLRVRLYQAENRQLVLNGATFRIVADPGPDDRSHDAGIPLRPQEPGLQKRKAV